MDKESKYFFQRMDGVLMLSFMASEAEVVSVAKDFGIKMTKPFCPAVNKEGRINYFGYVWEDVHKQAKVIIAKIKKEPKFLPNLVKMWRGRVFELKKFEQEILKMKLGKLSDEKLLYVFGKIVDFYQKEYSPALLVDPFGLHTEKIIVDKIRYLTEKRGEARKLGEYVQILTAPVTISFANQEEIDLLKIAKKLKRHQKIDKDILRHQTKYFWIENSYAQGIKLPKSYFLKKITRLFKEEINLDKKIYELENLAKNYKDKKKILIKKLNLGQELRDLLKWTEIFAYLHDERKAVMMEAYYYITLILKEIAKRTGLNLAEIYYTDYHKMEEILLNKKINKKLIKERMRRCVYLIWPKRYKIVAGREARKLEDKFLKEKQEVIGDINGVSASTGIATGKAKIVLNIKDGKKLKPGDILVTGMTRPHWMTFIKKAVAIVTEEGGITCHAVIVARELGIPCIIATKIATKIIKDGDLVEVDANKGIVKILKEKN